MNKEERSGKTKVRIAERGRKGRGMKGEKISSERKGDDE